MVSQRKAFGFTLLGTCLALIAMKTMDSYACASHGTPVSLKEMKELKSTLKKSKLNRHTAAESKVPPLLPTYGGEGKLSPWGGTESANWRPEAILANGFSRALNEAWQISGVADVTVAVSTHFTDSGFHPYNDGQSNSKPDFSDSWGQKRPPLVGSLLRMNSGTIKVLFRLDRALIKIPSPTSMKLEIFVRGGNPEHVFLPVRKDADGDYLADWSDIPASLGWNDLFQNQAVLVRLQPSFENWLPVFFRMPVRTADDLIDRTKPENRTFKGSMASLSLVDAKGKYHDPLGIGARASVEQDSPFNVLMSTTFPFGYNSPYYNPKNIHSEYGGPGGTITGVGQGWTWVAQNAQDRPFKIMYTCFEKRQPLAEASAPNGGVTSGGGWHVIGNWKEGLDPDTPKMGAAEIIINSLEKSSLVVSGGYANVLARTGAPNPPSGEFAYGLSDVATARWLKPGEGFIMNAGVTQPNHHWYLFPDPENNVCTEEWVGQCGVDFPCD